MTRRTAARLLAAFLFLLIIAYSAAWFALASKIGKAVPLISQQASQYGLNLEGAFSSVGGFPFRPTIEFSGRIKAPEAAIAIPSLKISAFPLPGQKLTLTLPQGLHLEDSQTFDGTLWSVQSAAITLIIPQQIPDKLTAAPLKNWHDHGGIIKITALSLRKESLKIDGTGALTLDDALQPAGQLDVTVKGYDDFITFLNQKGYIKPRQTMIARALLDAFAHKDPKNDQNDLNTSLILQKQKLFVGPLELLILPPVKWPD